MELPLNEPPPRVTPPPPEVPPTPSLLQVWRERWVRIRARVISGAIAALIAGCAIMAGSWWFVALVFLAALQMQREWDALTQSRPRYWQWLGMIYMLLPCLAALWLRGIGFENMPDAGLRLLGFLVLVICAVDIGAYAIGSRFGSHVLAPQISPGKTWEGLAGGLLCAGFVGAIASTFTPFPSGFLACGIWAILLGAIAQCGDLFESWLKRAAGVKDSGTLLPGHGGLLDRLDGYVFALPIFALLVLSSGLAL